MGKKHRIYSRKYTPAELQRAFELQYALYLEDLPKNENGKPDVQDFMTRIQEECRADPEKAARYVRDLREAEDRGVYLEDPLKLIKDHTKSTVWVVPGVINKYKMPKDKILELKEQIQRDAPQARSGQLR